MKKKIIRFYRDTIRSCFWETCVVYHPDGRIEIHSIHVRREDSHFLKEKIEWVSPARAEKYIAQNERYIIERYEE
jgi:hypothetical protein